MGRGVVLVVFVLLSGAVASAQDDPARDPAQSSIGDIARRIFTDPTTYAPAVLLYTSMRLDWTSSQRLFQNGFVEDNPRYTRSSLIHDVPVSYAAGNRRIARDSLAVLPMSLANNAASQVIERVLIERYPHRRKLVHTLGWIERVSFASYWSYRLSAKHFGQWQANQRLTRQLGYR